MRVVIRVEIVERDHFRERLRPELGTARLICSKYTRSACWRSIFFPFKERSPALSIRPARECSDACVDGPASFGSRILPPALKGALSRVCACGAAPIDVAHFN